MTETCRSSRHQSALQTAILGLSCGVGFFLAQEGWNKRFDLKLPKDLPSALLKNTFSWWLLLAGPYPVGRKQWLWYPLALYLAFTSSPLEEEKETQHDNANPENEPLDQLDPVTRHETSKFILEETPKATNAASKSVAPPEEKRYLEMLVHNVSHTDLVLSVNVPHDDDEYCLCRPRFSAFDLFSRRILGSLSSSASSSPPHITKFPRYERSVDTPRYSIVTPRPSRQALLPTGLELDSSSPLLQIVKDDLLNLRFRGRDLPRVDDMGKPAEGEALLQFNHVFFPLLATLLPRWHQQMSQNISPKNGKVKKVVLLVTGVGTPRNWTHSISGNSTQACAELMEQFIHILYPDVTVVRIHSDTNIFRYDENIVFVKRELVPCIDAYRDAHARGLPYPDEVSGDVATTNTTFSSDWKQSFAVTLSFADGSPARTHAIQTSLRSYRPIYFHFWQLKTFWHDTKIVDDDIEVHSFEEMETVPAMEASETTDKGVHMVVQEMIEFRKHFLETMQGRNDIRQFWLRKTKKPVLAVLLVEDDQGRPTLYRGTNMEVSMPTGSLCAERNVIGTALATNPGLKREDLRMVAVLAVPLPVEADKMEGELVRPSDMPRSMSLASYSSVVHADEEDDWIIPTDDVIKTEGMLNVLTPKKSHPSSDTSDSQLEQTPKSSPPGTPVRRITLYSRASETSLHLDKSKPIMGVGSRKQKRTVLIHSTEDLNPLRPCGACNEWLKKIAESNPYFKVVTFTDAECNGVYVSPCQE